MNDGYDFTDLSQKKNVFIFTFYNNFTIIDEFFIEQEELFKCTCSTLNTLLHSSLVQLQQ